LVLIVIKLPILEPYIDLFCLWLAKATVFVLHFFDGAVMRNEAIVYRKTYGYSFEVTKECSGLMFLSIFVSAVLAFPARAINKLKGLIFAVVVTVAINLFRLMTLLYLRVILSSDQFDVAHEQLWPLLLALSIAVAYSFWAYYTLRIEQFAGLLKSPASIKTSAEVLR